MIAISASNFLSWVHTGKPAKLCASCVIPIDFFDIYVPFVTTGVTKQIWPRSTSLQDDPG